MAGLFVHQGALGDWVVTWPILRGFVDTCGLVYAITSGQKASLAQRFIRGVEALDIEDGWPRLHQPNLSLPPDLPIDLGKVSHIISYVSNGQDAWAENIRRFAPNARIAFIQPRPPENWAVHVIGWQYLQLDRQLPVELPYDDPPAQPKFHGPIVIHPGSGGAAKCWPRDYFESLIAMLWQAGHDVKVVLGEVELETWPEDELARWNRDYQPIKPSSLDELADVLLEARLVITNDSGPMHLADQLGKPLLALFGPSELRHWHPIGELAATKRFIWKPPGKDPEILGPDRIFPLVKIWLDMSSYLEAPNAAT